MKKILLFAIISALLATTMASCKVEPKEDEVVKDEVVEDEASEEENLQPKYNVIYTPSDEIPAAYSLGATPKFFLNTLEK